VGLAQYKPIVLQRIMGLIKILASDGTELDYVKETLTLREDTNTLFTTFKLQYANNPFLILENTATEKALGSALLNSRNRKKVHEVSVITQGNKYKGLLTILEYFPAYRKCDLKFGTDLIDIMKTNIGNFMPMVSVTGDPDPHPYEYSTEIDFSADQSFFDAFVKEKNSTAPEDADFCFPMMRHYNRFGLDLEPDDDWYLYGNFINATAGNGDLILNELEVLDPLTSNVYNRNVLSPQVYVLAVLRRALATLGYKLNGLVPQLSFFRALTFFSEETQLTERLLEFAKENFDFNSVPWTSGRPPGFPIANFHLKKVIFNPGSEGRYKVAYKFTTFDKKKNFTYQYVYVRHNPSNFTHEYRAPHDGSVTEGSISFDIVLADVGSDVEVFFYTFYQETPAVFDVYFSRDNKDKNIYFFHPTIELSRYVPDWQFGTLINSLKNLFALDIVIDDHKKTFTINLAKDYYIQNQCFELSNLKQKGFKTPDFDSFALLYNNEEDDYVLVTDSGGVTNGTFTDYTEDITNRFKLMPRAAGTTDLGEAAFDKDGTGLLLFLPVDDATPAYTLNAVNDKTLNMDGPGGIYESWWKPLLKLRLQSSGITLTGYFTETEVRKLRAYRKVSYRGQQFALLSFKYNETKTGLFKVDLDLESLAL
jgi:hypothetical protein